MTFEAQENSDELSTPNREFFIFPSSKLQTKSSIKFFELLTIFRRLT